MNDTPRTLFGRPVVPCDDQRPHVWHGDGTTYCLGSPNPILRVQDRIDNLHTVADRFDHPGGSRALARRARDKAAGMETALRLLTEGRP